MKGRPARPFDFYVQKSDGCWEWIGARFQKGYGELHRKGKYLKAHRVAFERAFGPIPTGMLVCHTCDNPPCVRPDHLFLGTSADNSRDMKEKGRSMARHRNPKAKLTIEKVGAIRDRYHRGESSQPELAREYGVTQAQISTIVLNKQWVEK